MKENILDILGNVKDKTDELMAWGYDKYKLYSYKMDEYLDNEYSNMYDDIVVEENSVENENKEIYNFEKTRLTNYLIENFWMLPKLLEQYNISQSYIDEVITPLERRQKAFENKDQMDSLKMSIIFNEIYSDYSNKTLFEVGIVDEHGLPRINPIAFCYSNNTHKIVTENDISKAMDDMYVEEKEMDRHNKLFEKIIKQEEKFKNKISTPNDLYLKKYQDDLINYFKTNIEIGFIKNINDMTKNEYYVFLDNDSLHSVFKFFIDNEESKKQDQ